MSKTLLDSIAVVLPRYGESLGGGAETLVRAIVENVLKQSRAGLPAVNRLEVWTTCALDHRTWENHFPPGVEQDNGVLVRRFPVDSRDLDVFVSAEMAIAQGRPISIDEQLDWLANSVNSSALYRHIAEYGKEFDAILFAPYLFATTFWGSLIYPERSIVFPCLHNENYAYLDVFRHLFDRVRGLIFNAGAEQELAEQIYSLENFSNKSAVVGMGFRADSNDAMFNRSLLSLEQADSEVVAAIRGPYLLYSGRKEQGKNLDLLIEWFTTFRKRYPEEELSLYIIGSGDIHFLDELPEAVYDLGFVSEWDKARLMYNAMSLCQPSTNESFSIVLMEAWLNRTAVLVHGDCAVTREHVVESGGGLYFSSSEEFCSVLRELLDKPGFVDALGENGYHYVRDKYSWDAVYMRFYAALRRFGLIAGVRQTAEENIERRSRFG